jgi:DNA-binding NarL/FixJ family response regulator
MNQSQKKNQQKSTYSEEENRFLNQICEILNERCEITDFKIVRKMLNQQFHDSKPTRQLRTHFNCLNSTLKRGKLSDAEIEVFNTKIGEGKNLSKISLEMNREINSLKNHYYRYYKKEENHENSSIFQEDELFWKSEIISDEISRKDLQFIFGLDFLKK